MTRKASKERRQAITGVTASGISPAAELIASNVDLLTEILLRLPARSLIRFKCVSKHWLSLISHSQFASNHSSRNPRPSISGLYFYFYSRFLSVSLHGRRNLPSLSFLDGFGEQSPPRVLDFCNGLLLCYKYPSDGYNHQPLLIVSNPTTKESTILPSSHMSESWHVSSAYLAFDPSKSHHYKVLLFCPEIVVYCSHSACWKKFTIKQECWGRGVFWNGAIHWLSLDSLVRFDFDAEEMVVMPNPQAPKILKPEKTMYFGGSSGCLILIQTTLRYPLGFRILELDNYHFGWLVKCRVNLRPLIATFPDINYCVPRILRVLKGDKERDFTLILAFSGKIVSYDLKQKTWDVLRDGELDIIDFNHVYPIIEILSPV